jgi:hypothetical protein
MNLFKNRYFFAALLILISVGVYTIHYLIFRNAHDLFFYLIFDIAFVFIQVLMVTLIIERVISLHEKQAMLNKMNMVIGAFFSQVGTGLIKLLTAFCDNPGQTNKTLVIDATWDNKKFDATAKSISAMNSTIDSSKSDLSALRDFLLYRRVFLLGLLGNQNLLEHESFTELLWAVFHLAEELEFRKDLGRLSSKDMDHLSVDMKRAYSAVTREWLSYLKHLKTAYPYLYSLALRTNPFDPAAKAEIE